MVRKQVLLACAGHVHPLQLGGEAGGRWVVKISEKSLLGGGGSKISMLVGRGYIVGGQGVILLWGSRNFEVKIKTA